MDKLAYYQSLPRKRSACGVLFLKGDSLLVVKPSYKDGWSIPGGVIEHHESPLAACLRECREEIGIDIVVERLAVVDWMPSDNPEIVDSYQFIFIGSPLTAEQESQIVLADGELTEWRYVSCQQAVEMLSPNLKKRVRQALETRHNAATHYLESGHQTL